MTAPLIVDRWTKHRWEARVLVAKRRYRSRSFITREEAEAWALTQASAQAAGCKQPNVLPVHDADA